MAKPENWEVLRPYAEKLLNEPIPSTHDDAIISGFRAKLKNLFAKGKEESARVVTKAQGLFDCLKAENPYATEIGQVAKLYASDISSGNDINLLLHALKEAFAYQAFDNNASSQTEIDDLANRLKNYRDVQNLLKFDTELRAASAYVTQALPDTKDLKAIREAQSEVAAKLANIRTYIDSEVALTTELVGQTPPASGETGTITTLIRDYTEAYATLLDTVMAKLEEHRASIEAIPVGETFKALQTLERYDDNPLHEKLVIWAGGHVRKEDQINGDCLIQCALREVQEELRLSIDAHELSLQGAIYSELGERSAQHVAIVYEWKAATDDIAVVLSSAEFFERRGTSLSGSFVPPKDLALDVDKEKEKERKVTEEWSVEIVREILAKDIHTFAPRLL